MTTKDDCASKDDLLLQNRRLLGMTKPELQVEWREVDCGDFEPVAKPDVLAAMWKQGQYTVADFL